MQVSKTTANLSFTLFKCKWGTYFPSKSSDFLTETDFKIGKEREK